MIDNLERALRDFWFKPVDPVRLDTFRRLFALSFLVYMTFWFMHPYEWLTDYGFHITAQNKSWFQINPFPLLPHWAVPLFGLLLFGTTITFIVREHSRALSLVLLVLAIYVKDVDNISAFTLNKFYVLFFALLTVAPKPRRFFPAPGAPPVTLQSAWPVRIIQATLIIQFFTAGTCKLMHGEWHENPYVLWSQVQGLYCTDFAAFLLRNLPLDAWALMMYSALLFELLAPVLLMVKPLRPIGYLWGVSLLMMIASTMYMLFFFAFQMCTFFLVFIDAGLLRAVRARLTRLLPGRLAVSSPS